MHIVTGHCQNDEPLELDWHRLADPERTIVIYMGLASLERICRKLMAAGLSSETPVAVIENGTTRQQRQCIATLDRISEQVSHYDMRPPVMIVIGRVVSLAGALDWFSAELPAETDALHKGSGAYV